jgi:predicted phosphodiesterase
MLALLADIHGNLPALDAVISDMHNLGVQDALCLGDVANFGPQPCETLAVIAEQGWPSVLGNTDATLLDPTLLDSYPNPTDDTPIIQGIERWCASLMTTRDKAHLRTFVPVLEQTLGGLTLLAYHGSPRSYNDPITWSTSDETLQDYFDGYKADIFAGGHTHDAFLRRFEAARVLNPGSVGFSYVRARNSDRFYNLPVAEYALLDVCKAEPQIHFRRVPYKLEVLERAVRNCDMPHQDWWLGTFTTTLP